MPCPSSTRAAMPARENPSGVYTELGVAAASCSPSMRTSLPVAAEACVLLHLTYVSTGSILPGHCRLRGALHHPRATRSSPLSSALTARMPSSRCSGPTKFLPSLDASLCAFFTAATESRVYLHAWPRHGVPPPWVLQPRAQHLPLPAGLRSAYNTRCKRCKVEEISTCACRCAPFDLLERLRGQ